MRTANDLEIKKLFFKIYDERREAEYKTAYHRTNLRSVLNYIIESKFVGRIVNKASC